jgi:SAM-dependent methyltransferase
MTLELTNYLYRNPELYDRVFRTAPTGDSLKKMCAALLADNGKEPPASVLDIGCGTSFKLAHLADLGYDCTGVDFLDAMVSYSRNRYPNIDFEVGDIRSVRLNRTFDVITSLGWVIENVNSTTDIARAMETFAAHSKPGTLLVFDTHNPIGDLHAQGSRSEFAVDIEDFQATAQATFEVDRRRQILTRHRTWTLPDGREEIDVAHFRMFFPMELEHYLDLHGFDVVDMFDNVDRKPTELNGSMLYITATYRG